MAEEKNIKKRKKKDDAEEAASWLMTYGDMMTLLLTFFVLLISFSSIQETKFEMAMGSLKASLGVLVGERGTLHIDSKLPLMKYTNIPKDRFMISLQRVLMYVAEAYSKNQMVEVEVSDQGLLFRISNNLLFEVGKADLIPTTKEFLSKLSDMLSKIEGKIRVEGHTCDLPISTTEFPSNWELSAKRAINVLKFFHKEGVAPEHLTAIGHGEFCPIAPNDNAENRKKNRRVEIFVEFLPSEFDEEMIDVLNQMIEPLSSNEE
jgi:chemotaxis protein MotB